MNNPLITIAVPSYNQGCFLNDALNSIFAVELPVEVYVLDGGSTDNSLDVIHRWKHCLAGWRSHSDAGQASAINEGIALGSAPYVCWLNSDDWYLPEGLATLVAVLENNPQVPAAYGCSKNYQQNRQRYSSVWVEPFKVERLALRCIISQPATLIRRSAWEAVQGLRPDLDLAMDYDLWWKLFRAFGPLMHVNEYIAVNREHNTTKTKTQRRRHYQEARAVVREHYGSVPLKWWLAVPYAVWLKSFLR